MYLLSGPEVTSFSKDNGIVCNFIYLKLKAVGKFIFAWPSIVPAAKLKVIFSNIVPDSLQVCEKQPNALTKPYPQTLHLAIYFMHVFIYGHFPPYVGDGFKIKELV